MTYDEAAKSLYDHLTNNGSHYPRWLQSVGRRENLGDFIIFCNTEPPKGAVPGIWPPNDPDGFSVLYRVVGPLNPIGRGDW